MLLQIIHLFLAAAAAYYTTAQLKWAKRGDAKVRGIDGIWTVLTSLGLGVGYVWLLGWLASLVGISSGLNWLVGGMASYALCGFVHEWAKDKAEKKAVKAA